MLFILLLLASWSEAKRLRGTATQYEWPGGGNSCGATSSMCGAISDGWNELWSALSIPSKCGKAKYSGSCNNCGSVAGPSCPYNHICKKKLCVRCADSASVCRSKNWFLISMADACPSTHPCNTCKGKRNPCGAGRPHIDLCDGVFRKMYTSQPNWKGNQVEVSTDLSVCKGGSPSTPTPSPSGCKDVRPPGKSYTCAEQKGWGKCGKSWMKGYCKKTCGTCGKASAVKASASYEYEPSLNETEFEDDLDFEVENDFEVEDLEVQAAGAEDFEEQSEDEEVEINSEDEDAAVEQNDAVPEVQKPAQYREAEAVSSSDPKGSENSGSIPTWGIVLLALSAGLVLFIIVAFIVKGTSKNLQKDERF